MYEEAKTETTSDIKEIAYDFANLLYKQFTKISQDGRNNQDKNYEDNLINQ